MFQAPETDTDPAVGGFKAPDDDPDPKTFAGFGANAVQDVKGNAKNLVNLAEGLAEHPIDTIKNVPGALVNEGKRIGIGDLLTGHPVDAAGTFLNAAYEKPISTALDVAPVVGAAGKALGLGGAAAEGAEAATQAADAAKLAEEAAPAAEAPPMAQAMHGDLSGAATAPQFEVIRPDPVTPPPPSAPTAAPGGTPPSQPPPPPPSGPAPAPSALSGISDEIKNYVNSKYQAAQAKPGLIPKIGNYLTEESNKLGSKDVGLQSGLIKTMGTGFKGIEKANQLVDYARENGYLKAGLSDAERRAQIANAMNKSGAIIGKMRQLADSRGAPDVDAIKTAVKSVLDQKYGYGPEKAPGEIANVMESIEKAPKTYQGMADLATHLNKSATAVGKLGQHPGPTTDAADIVARMGNEGARKSFSPEENNLFTQNLRDFGANKKLEQTTSMAARREMGARSNQRGILGRAWQEALDRGGYRMGGNIANRLGKSIQAGKVKTLPQFFEDLAHQSNEEIDDTIKGMSRGGIVPHDVREWVHARGS